MEKYIYIFLEAIICLILVFFIILFYVRKGTNIIVINIAIFTWFLNFFMVVLLPYDIFITNKLKSNEKLSPDDEITGIIIKISYNIIYWSIFFCNWIIIPFLDKYEDCGEFTRIDKIKYSIRRNIIRYIFLLLICIILFIWAYIKLEKEQFSYFINNIFNFNYIYRLSVVLILLSYSLIKFPIKIYEMINYQKTIQYYEYEAKYMNDKLCVIKCDLKENGYLLKITIEHPGNVEEMTDDNLNLNESNKSKKLKKQNKAIGAYEKYLKEKYDYLCKNAKVFDVDLSKNAYGTNPEPITDKKKLVELNKNIINGQWDNLRLQCQIQSIYYKWCLLKTIIYQAQKRNYIKAENEINLKKTEEIINTSNKNDKIDESFIPLNKVSFILVWYYIKIRKYLLYFSTFFLYLLAGIVILSEISIALPFNLSLFSLLINSVTNIFLLHIFLFAPIIYLFIMAMYTFFKLKIAGFYGMYSHRQTDAASLLFFSENLSQIVIPLCLNIILMVNHGENIHKTILENNFNINVQNQVFNIYNNISPIILILFLLVHGFNVFNRLGKCFGLDDFYIQSEKRESDIEEGYDILMGLNKKYIGQSMSITSLEEENTNLNSSINIDFNRAEEK